MNPLFSHCPTKLPLHPSKATLNQKSTSHHTKQQSRHNSPEIDYDDFHYPHSRSHQEKSSSSGYEGSNGASSLESGCNDQLKNVEDSGVFVDQNPAYVKSIRVRWFLSLLSNLSKMSGSRSPDVALSQSNQCHRNSPPLREVPLQRYQKVRWTYLSLFGLVLSLKLPIYTFA